MRRILGVGVRQPAGHLLPFLLQAIFETGRLVLGVPRDCCVRSVRYARPDLLAGLRVPVFVRRLLYLRPDLHAVVRVRLDQRLGREQAEV